jgi:hypothetical protein
MARVTHQADRLAQDTRERLDDIDRRAEVADEPPIPFAIVLECLFSFLKQFQDCPGRICAFDRGSEGIFGKVYSSCLCIIGQGIGDQLDAGSGGC